MSLRISSPTEGTAFSGYWTVEFLDRGDLVAEVQLSGEVVDDVLDGLDLEDLRGALDFLEQVREATQ